MKILISLPVLPEGWLKATGFGDLPTLACQEEGEDEGQEEGDEEDMGETKLPSAHLLFGN